MDYSFALRSELLARLRPGALGLPLRGDDFLAASTIASSSDFGTVISFRITSEKLRNSGVESNDDAFTIPLYDWAQVLSPVHSPTGLK